MLHATKSPLYGPYKRVPQRHKRPVLVLIFARQNRVRNQLIELSLRSLEAAMFAVLGGRLYMMVIEVTRVKGSK